MSSTASETQAGQQLALLFQYTVEAYKTFEKLAELLPNPISAAIFANFAEDERAHRDLLEAKYRLTNMPTMTVTLGGDLRFREMIDGDLSFRESTEFLMSRERTMERKLMETARAAEEKDRNLFLYIAAAKRAHLVYLERELEFIRLYSDWFDREDAESVIVRGEQK